MPTKTKRLEPTREKKKKTKRRRRRRRRKKKKKKKKKKERKENRGGTRGETNATNGQRRLLPPTGHLFVVFARSFLLLFLSIVMSFFFFSRPFTAVLPHSTEFYRVLCFLFGWCFSISFSLIFAGFLFYAPLGLISGVFFFILLSFISIQFPFDMPFTGFFFYRVCCCCCVVFILVGRPSNGVRVPFCFWFFVDL